MYQTESYGGVFEKVFNNFALSRVSDILTYLTESPIVQKLNEQGRIYVGCPSGTIKTVLDEIEKNKETVLDNLLGNYYCPGYLSLNESLDLLKETLLTLHSKESISCRIEIEYVIGNLLTVDKQAPGDILLEAQNISSIEEYAQKMNELMKDFGFTNDDLNDLNTFIEDMYAEIKEQWNKIVIAEGNDCLRETTIVYETY